MELDPEDAVISPTDPEIKALQLSELDGTSEIAGSSEPPSTSTLRSIFMGPFGLRAGWSLLLFIALFVGPVAAVRVIHDHLKHTHTPAATGSAHTPGTQPQSAPVTDPNKPASARGLITQESIVVAIVLCLSWLMALIERRRFSAFGLGGVRSGSRFATGALWGLIAISALVGTLRALGFLSFDTMLDHGMAILGWGAVQLFAFFLVGLSEEFLFRGYLQFTLTRGLLGLGRLIAPTQARDAAFWLAAIVTSALFLLAHTGNSGEDKFGLFAVFLAGVLFIVALWRTGSLWWGIGFHMTWDWGQSFLYGVPDSGGLFQGRLFATHALGKSLLSGGSVGPEGSVFIFPVIVLAIAVLCFTSGSPQPALEQKTVEA